MLIHIFPFSAGCLSACTPTLDVLVCLWRGLLLAAVVPVPSVLLPRLPAWAQIGGRIIDSAFTVAFNPRYDPLLKVKGGVQRIVLLVSLSLSYGLGTAAGLRRCWSRHLQDVLTAVLILAWLVCVCQHASAQFPVRSSGVTFLCDSRA